MVDEDGQFARPVGDGGACHDRPSGDGRQVVVSYHFPSPYPAGCVPASTRRLNTDIHIQTVNKFSIQIF